MSRDLSILNTQVLSETVAKLYGTEGYCQILVLFLHIPPYSNTMTYMHARVPFLYRLLPLGLLIFSACGIFRPAPRKTGGGHPVPEHYRDLSEDTGPFNYNKSKSKEISIQALNAYELKFYFLAIDKFIQSLSYNSKNAAARYYLGKAYLRAGFLDNAVQEWQTLHDLNLGWPMLQDKIAAAQADPAGMPAFDLTSNYSYVYSVRGGFLSKLRFYNPTDILYDSTNHMLIADEQAGIVIKTDSNGRFVNAVMTVPKPFGIVLSKNRLYITDRKNNTLFMYSSDFSKIKQAGGHGQGPGQFLSIRYAAADVEGNIYVCDELNRRVQKFSADLVFIRSYGEHGPHRLERPYGLAMEAATRRLLVLDVRRNAIMVYQNDGAFVEHIDLAPVGRCRFLRQAGETTFLITSDKGVFFLDGPSREIRPVILTKSLANKSRPDSKSADAPYSCAALSGDARLALAAREASEVKVFIPQAFKTSNLQISIDHINTQAFPNIQVLFSAHNFKGDPLLDLTRENVIVEEFRRTVATVSLADRKRDFPGVYFTVLFDASPEIMKYRPFIVQHLKLALRNISPNDNVMLIRFNSEPIAAQPFVNAVFKVTRHIEETRPEPAKRVDLALIKGVESVFRLYHHRAIIFITDGTFRDDSFSRFSLETCIEYARRNFVPVYVLAYSGANESALGRLARKTGGQYFEAIRSNEIKNIYDRVRNQRLGQHIAIYHAPELNRPYTGRWRPVTLKIVKPGGLRGELTEGYFMPSKKKGLLRP